MTIFSPREVEAVRRQLDYRREALIKLARASLTEMDPLDQDEILKYLAGGLAPKRPEDLASLMKSFLKSCYTYSVVRNYCRRVLGAIPMPDTMGILMDRVFPDNALLEDNTWLPQNLKKTALRIQRREKLKLTSNQPRPRMLRAMLDGSDEMAKRLDGGLEPFYESIERVSASSAEAMWSFVEGFSKPIYNVGPNLICDFLKEIGFLRFVKVDHHFMRQFPKLMGEADCRRLSPKETFLLSQEVADAIGIEPYYLDRILYEWGRYGHEASKMIK